MKLIYIYIYFRCWPTSLFCVTFLTWISSNFIDIHRYTVVVSNKNTWDMINKKNSVYKIVRNLVKNISDTISSALEPEWNKEHLAPMCPRQCCWMRLLTIWLQIIHLGIWFIIALPLHYNANTLDHSEQCQWNYCFALFNCEQYLNLVIFVHQTN